MLSLSVCEHIVQHILLEQVVRYSLLICVSSIVYFCVFVDAIFYLLKHKNSKFIPMGGLLVEQIIFKIFTKNYFVRCTRTKQLGFGNLKKTKLLLC